MNGMYVLTVKSDGGTEDVLGFYTEWELLNAIGAAKDYLDAHRNSRRAIVRLEWYNPLVAPVKKGAE